MMTRRSLLCLGLVGAVALVFVWRWRQPASLPELQRLVLRRDWRQAQVGLEKFLRSKPDDDQALLLLAEVQESLNRSDEAIATLRRIGDHSPRKLHALFREAELSWNQHRPANAQKCWLEVIGRGENAVREGTAPGVRAWLTRSLGRLADLYLLESRDEEARVVLWKLIELVGPDNPSAADLLFRVTAIQVEEQDPAKSIEKLERFAANDPDNAEVRAALGHYRIRMGASDIGKALLNESLSLDPVSPMVRRTRLACFVEIGAKAELRRELAELPPRVLSPVDEYRFRGIDHQNHDEFAEAAECYRQGLRLMENDRNLLARLAQTLRLTGELDESRRRSEQVARLTQSRKELSELVAQFPPQPGGQLTAAECVKLAELCAALKMQPEAQAWRTLASRRDPSLNAASDIEPVD